MIIKSFYFSLSASKLRSEPLHLNKKMVDARKQKPVAVNVYLLSGVQIVIRYIEVDLTFELLDYV